MGNSASRKVPSGHSLVSNALTFNDEEEAALANFFEDTETRGGGSERQDEREVGER